MEIVKREQNGVNKTGTNPATGTPLTHGRSGPVRFRLIDKDGNPVGTFDTALEAASAAGGFWPGQGQDEDREGWGWDLEVVR